MSFQKTIFRRDVLGCVAKALDLRAEDITSARRDKRLVRARFISAHLMMEFVPNSTLPQIGHSLGDRDHTTVIHALRAAEREIKYNDDFAKAVEVCRQRVLCWQTAEPQTVNIVFEAPKLPPPVKSPPAVKFEPLKPIVRTRATRGGTEYYGGDVDAQWWAANDRRFRAAMRRAHPERCPASMLEAAE